MWAPRRDFSLKTLGVFSPKGGTGKTTVALHLAVAAVEAGLKVLVADLDPQHSAFAWRQARAKMAPEVVMPRANTLAQLQRTAATQDYDLMIIDTPPMIGPHVDEALHVSDFALAVTRPNALDLWAARRMVDIFQEAGRPCAFVLNQAPSKRAGREVIDVTAAAAQLQAYGVRLAPTGLRNRKVYSASLAQGLSAQEVGGDCVGATEVARLFQFVRDNLNIAEPRLSMFETN
jgi:chromosome partitioning protein